MRTILRWFVVVACFAGLFGGNLAFAGNPLARPTKREARGHLDRGNKLYNLRSFDEAIAEFKAGAIIEAVPVFDYNLGQAYRQLGKYEDALWHYDRFLNYGHPTGQLLDAVTASWRRCERTSPTEHSRCLRPIRPRAHRHRTFQDLQANVGPMIARQCRLSRMCPGTGSP